MSREVAEACEKINWAGVEEVCNVQCTMCKQCAMCNMQCAICNVQCLQSFLTTKTFQVIVAVRPWIRVDGTLNRRVLDRLLGATLGIVMQV